MNQELHNFIRSLPTTPFLFVGSGISRRYFNLPDWRTLLTHFINIVTNQDSIGWAKYYQSFGPDYANIAEALKTDFDARWFTDSSIRTLPSELMQKVTQENCSPFKAEIASYIDLNSKLNLAYKDEIDILKSLTARNIAGFITTNYDNFLNIIAPDYITFVGQEELLFNSIQNIAEIYKIHGSISNPDSIIITSSDYDKFNRKASYLTAKLLTIFLENPIIFIGYSISDKNIRNIIFSIADCLSTENLKKLENRFIVVEYDRDNGPTTISPRSMDINGTIIPMTKITMSNYADLYEALKEKRSALPVKMLRMFKNEFYNFILSSTPTQKLYVAGINDVRVDDEDLVLAIASPDQLGPKGLTGIEADELYKDILLDTIHNTADEILTYAYPKIIKQVQKLVVFKYLKKASHDYPEIRQKTNINCYDDFLSQTIKKNRSRKDYSHHTIIDLTHNLDYKNLDLVEKVNMEICFLPEKNITANSLYDHLKKIIENNPNIFSKTTKSSFKTGFRRLIRIYDWLKYGK